MGDSALTVVEAKIREAMMPLDGEAKTAVLWEAVAALRAAEAAVARLEREHEARERAAEQLCRIYFEIAERFIDAKEIATPNRSTGNAQDSRWSSGI